jgi:hypothetical protein
LMSVSESSWNRSESQVPWLTIISNTDTDTHTDSDADPNGA